MLRGVLLAFGAATLIGLTLALPARLTDADAQGSAAPAYEIDVLPGVAVGDPTNAKRWSIDAAGKSTMTAAANAANAARTAEAPPPATPTLRVDAIGVRVDDERAD